ncbi:hypothetical protein [Blastococcus sp. TF02A-30]|uniref:hypothetical protein n=1 Tax=Blastococcus sp. TF02A-30 TaxID=2250580 RepID=UPI000DEA7BFD|nr:hypothetical protein [Blastococcus sp. TF02A-30]RBY92668.1 hypothetical protein DQ241_00895 [Blastococcus sp. TF02A-30]
MAHGRILRTARRGVAAAVLGWLSVAAAAVVLAPSAAAAAEVPVTIRDLTPPLVSVDAGGTVIFTNGIQDKTVQVGGGLLPSLVTVVVHTDVTLKLPSGSYPLQPGQTVREKFPSTCLTCAITYTYRTSVPDTSIVGGLLNTVTGNALKLVPQNQLVTYDNRQTTVSIGVPTPFIVNTLVPLPNLPSVNIPQLPPLTVPAPGGTATPGVPGAPVAPNPGAEQPTTAPGAAPEGVPGSQYTYDTGSGGAQMAPGAAAAAAAFDPSRFSAPGRGLAGAGSGGSGGVAGGYDGASVPVFGQLAGLDGTDLDEESAEVDAQAAGRPAAPLPAAALAAVVALAAVTAALVRTHQASRTARSTTR